MDINERFELLGGSTNGGFPSIEAEAFATAYGTPYLVEPGVVVLSVPSTNILGVDHFLSNYSPSLRYDEYLQDPTLLSGAAQICKAAGQLCYMSFGRRRTTNAQASAYLDNIKDSGHGSVLEHANFSLLLYGLSRSVTHELVRHRAGMAFSQQSQRYVAGSVLRFVERPEYISHPKLHMLFCDRIDRIAQEHKAISEVMLQLQQEGDMLLSAVDRTDLRKKVQQAARSILPNETESPIVATGNVRAWRHIIESRASAHAEVEIREVAFRIFLCLYYAEPLLFSDYKIVELGDGTQAVETAFAKV